ncbi:hypothetical protein ABFG93_18080 [Pseudalkalibacillus hwajinpoensis]|uniref:hypothetical protein n=1 Tax=Guptibacillus hwajinpoensis TaxID=208199 RepID=UPI00325AF084
MDNEKRTISIRLNGEDVKKPPSTHKEESAAAEEKEFEWILPERRDSKKVVEFKRRHLQKKTYSVYDLPKKRSKLPVKRKKKKPPIASKPVITLQKKVIASAGLAIVLGVLFGASLLMVFAGDHAVPTITATKEEDMGSVTGSKTDLSLDLHVVQSGAYETEESAKEFEQKIKGEGIPAAVFRGEKYYLLIGVSSTVEGQDALGDYFTSKGQDVYKKVWSINGEDAVLSSEEGEHLLKGKVLLEELAALDIAALSDNGLSEDDLKRTAEAIQSWEEKGGAGIEQWEENGGQELSDSINGGLEEVQAYSSEETVSSLWIAQQHLLDGLSAYQELVESMK